MAHRLVITMILDNEEESLDISRAVVDDLDHLHWDGARENTVHVKVTLVRENDKSAGNLLLPRLEGRMGNHLQSRKADLSELVSGGENELGK